MKLSITQTPSDLAICEGEILPGFLLRIAAYFRMTVDNLLLNVVGRPENLPVAFWEPDIVNQISRISGVDEAILRASQIDTCRETGNIVVGEETLPRRYVTFSDRKVCSQSLADDIERLAPPYHRKDWTLNHIIASPSGKASFSYHCEFCHSGLNWQSAVHVDRCNICGSKLWLQRGKPLGGKSLAYCELLQDQHVFRSFGVPNFNKEFVEGIYLSSIDRLELMDALAYLATRSDPKVMERGLLDARLSALETMADGAQGVAVVLNRLKRNRNGGNTRLGPMLAYSSIQAELMQISNLKVRNLLTSLSQGSWT